MAGENKSLSKFKDLLQKLFLADMTKLDFGIYRIMNLMRERTHRFIDEGTK